MTLPFQLEDLVREAICVAHTKPWYEYFKLWYEYCKAWYDNCKPWYEEIRRLLEGSKALANALEDIQI